MKIGVIDYDAGNLKSVETALAYLNADFLVSSDPEKLKSADKIIFPGVGEADQAMTSLTEKGLDHFLKEYSASGKAVLGICLGSQIILSHSEESDTNCLNIVSGEVKRFPKSINLKIPHMGWNTVSPIRNSVLFEKIPDNTSFYFVHSYYTDINDSSAVLAESEYGIKFTCGITSGNIAAFQFHPEKSGKYGLQLLDNFISRFE